VSGLDKHFPPSLCRDRWTIIGHRRRICRAPRTRSTTEETRKMGLYSGCLCVRTVTYVPSLYKLC
jgi:hypothetical protein